MKKLTIVAVMLLASFQAWSAKADSANKVEWTIRKALVQKADGSRNPEAILFGHLELSSGDPDCCGVGLTEYGIREVMYYFEVHTVEELVGKSFLSSKEDAGEALRELLGWKENKWEANSDNISVLNRIVRGLKENSCPLGGRMQGDICFFMDQSLQFIPKYSEIWELALLNRLEIMAPEVVLTKDEGDACHYTKGPSRCYSVRSSNGTLRLVLGPISEILAR